MKKAKAKAPARKAAKTSRPSAKAKASARAPARTAPGTPAKPELAKGKVARPVAIVKSSSKTASRVAEKPIVTAPREPLTMPPKPAPAVTAPIIPSPTAVPPKPAVTTTKPLSSPAPRADVPPETGFTLLVDGHFKNEFETLAQAKQAATELKTRFPILRIAVYDAASKTRLPV